MKSVQKMSDNLLVALGSMGEITLKRFDKIFTELCLKDIHEDISEEFKNIRRRAIRYLDGLGYCEFDFEKSKVYPCKPSLICLPGGPFKRAVLTGSRSEQMIQDIKDFAEINKQKIEIEFKKQSIYTFSDLNKFQPIASFPSSIIIESQESLLIDELGKKIRAQVSLDCPASWILANFSIGLEEYRKNIKTEINRELDWSKRVFSIDLLQFRRQFRDQKPDGLVEYINDRNNARVHYFWNNGLASNIDRDWGRFHVLGSHQKKIVLYDFQSHNLVIPSTTPLPRILFRSLVLCSGQLPIPVKTRIKKGDIPEGSLVEIYSGVPPEYAEIISSKLSQQLVNTKIKIDEKGVKIQ
jgi:hypothetical protein